MNNTRRHVVANCSNMIRVTVTAVTCLSKRPNIRHRRAARRLVNVGIPLDPASDLGRCQISESVDEPLQFRNRCMARRMHAMVTEAGGSKFFEELLFTWQRYLPIH